LKPQAEADLIDKGTIYNILAVAVVVLAILGYALGWFGGGAPPPATTAPPSAAPPAATAPAPTPAPAAPGQ
jgi:hypothetical protein